jgi:hypothetical protein
MMGVCGKHYLILLGFWATLNFIYLAWFFGLSQSAKHIQTLLERSQNSG